MLSFKNLLSAAGIVALCSALLVSYGHAASTLTIKGSSSDPGDIIEFPEGAKLDVAVGAESITLTMPDIDLRVQCLGTPTEDGYCLLEAGSGSGGGAPSDSDGDGVYDGIDSCGNTPNNSIVSSNGCSPSDSDGDGIYNQDDNCASTPSGSFVNASGCSSAQLGGGSNPDPDRDGDGTPDGQDECPDDASNTCNDPDPDDPAPSTSDYCSNPQRTNVTCSRSNNFDTWYATSGENQKTIPSGKVLSIPFTTRDSTSDGIKLVYTTDNGPLLAQQYAWRSWVSQYPGGSTYGDQSACFEGGSQARTSMSITQDPTVSGACKLPATKGTYYLNYRVWGNAGYYPRNYAFDVAKR